eukprot:3127430-Pleurochrysis_carterae.AAC.1
MLSKYVLRCQKSTSKQHQAVLSISLNVAKRSLDEQASMQDGNVQRSDEQGAHSKDNGVTHTHCSLWLLQSAITRTKTDRQVFARAKQFWPVFTIRAPPERNLLRPVPLTPNGRLLRRDSGAVARPSFCAAEVYPAGS